MKIKQQIVISRYDEDLNWISKIPSKYEVIVYNKGEDDLNDAVKSRIDDFYFIENVGREGHTYLHHICENYENLPDNIFFTQAKPHWRGRPLSYFFNFTHKRNPQSIIEIKSNEKSCGHIRYIDNENPPTGCPLAFSKRWNQTTKSKKDLTTWWDEMTKYKFPLKEQCKFSYHGTFSVNKYYINLYPLEYFENLRTSLSVSTNPEEGHFLERAWGTIFNPDINLTTGYEKSIPRGNVNVKGNNKNFSIKLPNKTNRYVDERVTCIQNMIQDTIQKYNLSNRFEFLINLRDKPIKGSYSFSTKTKNYDETFPDWSFFAWPSAGVNGFCETIKNSLPTKPPQHNKIGWIGSLLGVSEREQFVENFGDTEFSEALTTNGCFNLKVKKPPKFMTYKEQFQRWKYLIDIRGIGYSGRTKYLMHSNRIVFLVNSPFEEYWYQFLEPWKHYIPVKEDYSDLKQNYYTLENDKKLQKYILSEQNKFAKTYITYDYSLLRIKNIILENLY